MMWNGGHRDKRPSPPSIARLDAKLEWRREGEDVRVSWAQGMPTRRERAIEGSLRAPWPAPARLSG